MRSSVVLALVLAGCSDQQIIPQAAVQLTIDSPTYGEFVGAETIAVQGHVDPPSALVKVDGAVVPVALDGTFTAEIPFTDRYHVVDAEAAAGGSYQRVRVPCFDGHDPVATWPGAITFRLTPDGLGHLGNGLGTMIDATGWDTQIAAALPSFGQQGLFELTPLGVTHDPSTVLLTPADGYVDTGIELHNVMINYDVAVTILGYTLDAPLSIGLGTTTIDAQAVPAVDADGLLSLSLNNPALTLGDPHIVVDGFDPWIVDLIVQAVSDWVITPLSGLLLGTITDQIGTIPLGGPYAFSQDVMGTSLDIQLSEVNADLQGIGLGLGVGIDAPIAAGPLSIPPPDAGAPPIHAELGLHEGLLETMLGGTLSSYLDQDLTLPGTVGELIGNGIRNLPGGSTAPAGDGWCIAIHPGHPPSGDLGQIAQVVRLQSGIAPLAILYLPDLGVTLGIDNGGTCDPWLTASLETKIGLVVQDGTKIGIDIHFVGGAVTWYGATSEWEESEVIDGLSGFLNGAMGLLGGQFSFDLSTLTGGLGAGTGTGTGTGTNPLAALGDVQPKIIASEPMLDANGQPIEGLYAVGLQLWDEVPQ